MEFLRQNYWTVLLLAIVLVSLVIIIIFVFINFASVKEAWYSTQAKPNHYDGTHFEKQENPVHHKFLENEKPPLPPRDQFLSMDSVDQSYEEVEPVPDYVVVEGSTPPTPQQPTFTPHYTTVERKSQDQDQDSEDYDDVEIPENDSEDYDDVEMPANCDSEDYDDLG